MRPTVVVFDSLGHQAELRGWLPLHLAVRLPDQRHPAGSARALRALWRHLRVAHRA